MSYSAVTSSRPAAPREGSQTARITVDPPAASTTLGERAVRLSTLAGLTLDPWQASTVTGSLAQRDDRTFAAMECGLIVPRQNGKGSVIEARQLAGLFLLHEQQQIYSAHQFKTAKAMYRRVSGLIRETPALHKQVKAYRQSNEETGVELHTGERLNFFARSGGSGRGFTGDSLIFDEAYDLSPDLIADMLPTLAAVPNPQVWYVSSAGMTASEQLAAVRARGLKMHAELVSGGQLGPADRLFFREWSAADDAVSSDVEAILQANPGIGHRLSLDFVLGVELPTMDDEKFRRERLGIWQPPDAHDAVIEPEVWATLRDSDSRVSGKVAFAVDVSPSRGRAAIAAAGRRDDGKMHVEVIESAPGTAWVVPRLVELVKSHRPVAVVLYDGGPSGALVAPLRDAGVEPLTLASSAVAKAYGALMDAATSDEVRHLGQPALDDALAGATTRLLGDGTTWDFKNDRVDLTPLVSVTLAQWGYLVQQPKRVNVAASVW